MKSPARGFTLIEMVVVMATIGLLLALALPAYFSALERGRQQVLQQNLALMREALDKHYGDTGRYPDKLEDLVTRRYLRAIPADPYTESATWVVVAPKDPAQGGVIDVRSTGLDTEGRPRAGTEGAGDAPPPMVLREGGALQTVTVAPLAAEVQQP